MSDRLTELQALSWQQQRAIASSLGLTKPADQSWDEFCQTIVDAENAASPAEPAPETPDSAPDEQPEPADSEAPSPVEPEPTPTEQSPIFEIYSDSRGQYCSVCRDRLRTGLQGEPICPIINPLCPRHK